tara:strand:+ start:189182 stop:189739 length:558 start_codon:yes stop_codon:yes gene_type:complete
MFVLHKILKINSIMKKVFSLVLFAVLFASCSSDDDNNNTVAIEGTWKMTAFKSQNAYDLNGDGVISNDIMAQTNCYENETLVFNSNGTGANLSTSYADITLEVVAGTTDEYEYSVACVTESTTTAFVWTQNGDTVTLTDSGVTFTGAQDGNKLTFAISNGFEIEVEEGDGVATVTETLTLEYTKQ